MSEKIDYWGTFKEFLESRIINYGDNTASILMFGLSGKVTDIFKITQKEMINGVNLEKDRVIALKSALTYIAYFELLYKLPPSPYTNFIGTDFKSDESIINLLDTQSEALVCCSDISNSIVVFDNVGLQTGLNNLILSLLDICHAYDIDTKDCVDISIPGVNNEKVNSVSNVEAKNTKPELSPLEKEFRESRSSIRKEKKNQALFDIKLASGNKYRGIILGVKGKKKTFYTKNIIVDFFTASNYLHNNNESGTYLINYSAKFREVMHADPDNLYMGFLVEDKVITAGDLIKNINNSAGGSEMVNTKNGRPVLLTPDIKDLDSMLEMVNKVRSSVN